MQNLNHLPIHQLNGWEDIYLLIFGHNQQETQQEQVITRLLDSRERLGLVLILCHTGTSKFVFNSFYSR